MLVDALSNLDLDSLETILPGDSPIHKRMPQEIESTLMNKFEEYKNGADVCTAFMAKL